MTDLNLTLTPKEHQALVSSLRISYTTLLERYYSNSFWPATHTEAMVAQDKTDLFDLILTIEQLINNHLSITDKEAIL